MTPIFDNQRLAITLSQCGLSAGQESTFSRGFNCWMACENYFQLQNHREYSILEVNNDLVTAAPNPFADRSSGFISASLKVLSYFTTILPIIAGVVIAIQRSQYQIETLANRIGNVDPEFKDSNSNVSKAARNKEGGLASSHRILGNLHLGNVEAFLDCTNLPLYDGYAVGGRQRDNPMDVKHVVTMCPLTELHGTYQIDSDPAIDVFAPMTIKYGEAIVRDSLLKTGVHWLHAGKGLKDIAVAHPLPKRLKQWAVLVHNTTFPNSYLPYLNHPDLNEQARKENANSKYTVILERNGPDVKEWFQPAFKVLDKAVFHGEKTLVHCAMGISRSSTLVVAYFINRFNIDVDAAIAYIRSKRPIIDPGFANELKAYQKHLRRPLSDPPPMQWKAPDSKAPLQSQYPPLLSR